jgi:hypothetical protein
MRTFYIVQLSALKASFFIFLFLISLAFSNIQQQVVISQKETDVVVELLITKESHTIDNDPNLLKVMLNDTLQDLQEGNSESAVMHLNLVKQQLTTLNDSSLELSSILIDDASKDIEKGDPNAALMLEPSQTTISL